MSVDDDLNDFREGIRFASEVWKTADRRGVIDAIKEFFSRPDPILVLGSTGSGKTAFLRSLATSASVIASIPRWQRTEQVERARIKIGDRPFLLTDTPGPRAHKHLRDKAIREALADPPVRIMNVVSYGYLEPKVPLPSDAVDEDGIPRSEFLAQGRLDELANLGEWLPILGDRDCTQWILTIATKADLWWDDEQAVAHYYDTGPYTELIKATDQKLHHVVQRYCSVVHRFFDVSRLPGSFDDSIRLLLSSALFSQLATLMGSDQ
jgi:hypothetical protein